MCEYVIIRYPALVMIWHLNELIQGPHTQGTNLKESIVHLYVLSIVHKHLSIFKFLCGFNLWYSPWPLEANQPLLNSIVYIPNQHLYKGTIFILHSHWQHQLYNNYQDQDRKKKATHSLEMLTLVLLVIQLMGLVSPYVVLSDTGLEQ